MSEYTIEYHPTGRYGGRDALQNVPTKPLPYAVMVNGKGGLQIAGYISQELADMLKPLLVPNALEDAFQHGWDLCLQLS